MAHRLALEAAVDLDDIWYCSPPFPRSVAAGTMICAQACAASLSVSTSSFTALLTKMS